MHVPINLELTYISGLKHCHKIMAFGITIELCTINNKQIYDSWLVALCIKAFKKSIFQRRFLYYFKSTIHCAFTFYCPQNIL